MQLHWRGALRKIYLSQWADRNDLKLKKTNLMLIGRKRREELNEVKIEMRDQLLERSRTVKCLGVLRHAHVTKNTRLSPALPYCKRQKAGRGLGTRLWIVLGRSFTYSYNRRGALRYFLLHLCLITPGPMQANPLFPATHVISRPF